MKNRCYLYMLAVAFCMSSAQSLLPKAIVWDLGDTLFQRSTYSAMMAVGVITGARFWFRHGGQTGNVTKRSMWDVMNEYGDECIADPEEALDPNGERQPDLMCDWFAGRKSSSEMKSITLSLADRYPHFEDDLHKEMIKRVFTWMFTPEEYAASLYPAASLVKILEQCAAQKSHKLMILSNFDAETFHHLYHNPGNACVFKHFEPENMIVSAHKHDIKPHTSIFNMVIAQAGVPAGEMILIDDQLENCLTARKLGMQAIHVKKGEDASVVVEQLKAMGVVLN